MSAIRIGFVGVGQMGQCAHLQNYIGIEGCEVAAIAEIRPELRRLVGARYGVTALYADHREMLDACDLDAVVCIQPYSRHGQLLPDLYDRGLLILTEKPLARSVTVGRALLEHLQSTTSRHLLAYHKRSDPASLHAVSVLEAWRRDGTYGKLRHLRVTMPPGDWIANGFAALVRTQEAPPDLAVDPPAPDLSPEAYARYDAFVNYYIHQVNLIRYLLGEPWRVSYVDPAGVVLVGHGEVSGTPVTLEMAPWTTRVDWQESVTVGFDHAWLQLDLPAPLAHHRPGRVRIHRDGPKADPPMTEEPTLPWVHAMRRQAEFFCAAVRGETTPLCEAAEALLDLEIAASWVAGLPSPAAP